MKNLVSTLTAVLLLITGCSDSSDNRVDLAPLLERYVLSSADSVPEGVAFDPEMRDFFATSLNGGSLTRVTAAGDESLFREPDDRAQLLGAKVDPAARRLWVCAQEVDGVDNRVWVFDLRSGELANEFLLGAITTGGSCNDLVLDADGIAYVTDPVNPFLYRLDLATGEGEVLATDPLFEDITGLGLGLNGITLTADGSTLIVARFAPAALLRVRLSDGTVLGEVALSGDLLTPPDGLAELDGDIYAVSDSFVNRIRLSDDFSEGTVVSVAQIGGLSTATVAEGQLYVIKSEVTNYVIGTPFNLPFEIFRIDLAEYGP